VIKNRWIVVIRYGEAQVLTGKRIVAPLFTAGTVMQDRPLAAVDQFSSTDSAETP
jgi:hypothetical protein